MKVAEMKKYARLIAVKGIGVVNGDRVVIKAELDQPKFVEYLTDACYRAGAEEVRVEWNHQPLTKIHTAKQRLHTLQRVEEWELAKLTHNAEVCPSIIYLMSEDPDGLTGINQAKYSAAVQARAKVFKPIRDKMDNHYRWCIAAVPGTGWSKKVFPALRSSAAVEKLWEAILYTSRADGDDPVAAWDAHNKNLSDKCARLNSLGLAELEYRSSNGTDFRVGLIPDADFLGGLEHTIEGKVYNPNIPSEEVFTSPMRGKAEGVVHSSRPLSYRGETIENFTLWFKDGKVVDHDAEKGKELLGQLLSMDEGARYLGECALVPYDSPICRSGITFYNTLFDENACCHIALGRGFNETLRGYSGYTLSECKEKGINDSIIHEDLMIGTEDLNITGITSDGKRIPIFSNGNWAETLG